MKIFRRYIINQVMGAITIVLVALTGLQLFILFVNQIQDIGRADYTLLKACQVVFFQLPYQLYLFFPIACLLGALVGLGQMANYRELIVLRASGLSISQIGLSVSMLACLLMIIVCIAGEIWIPQCIKRAVDVKIMALTKGQTLRANTGTWVRQGNDFIFIHNIVSRDVLEGVVQFHFDSAFHLKNIRHINQIRYVHGTWITQQVSESTIHETHIQTNQLSNFSWEIHIDPRILSLSGSEVDEMTLRQLYAFILANAKNHQNVFNMKLVFWQRIMQPFSTVVMTLLAIPFVFGPLRNSTIGSKVLMGACCGFIFYTCNHFLVSASHVFQLPPLIVASLPTTLFGFFSLFLMRRVY